MEMRFLGPLGKVTGSCTWMRDSERGWGFLVDCGMQQGERTAQGWNAGVEWPFQPSQIQFVALTHAHIDHCGLIPLLYKRGFQGSVYCTRETARLADVLLRDAARFPETPYEEADVQLVKWHTPGGRTVLGGHHPVADDLFLRFFRSGHIIGASSVTVAWGPKGESQKSIVFSGDVGPGSENLETLPILRFRQYPKPADYAVLETTYGDTVRQEQEKCAVWRRDQIIQLLDRVLETRGTLAIPAFAVGRTQDLMFDLHRVVAGDPERYSAIDFYIDSPTAMKVNEITLDALRETQTNGHSGKVRPLWLGKQLFRELDLDDTNPEHREHALAVCTMTMTLKGQPKTRSGSIPGNEASQQWSSIFRPLGDRNLLLCRETDRPRVVIMGSGTCDGGAAALWLPTLTQSEQNIIALSGYCAPETIGGQLLRMMNAPVEERQLQSGSLVWKAMSGNDARQVPFSTVRAQIEMLKGYSAHADQLDLVSWLFQEHRDHGKQAIGRTVFLQHGGDRQREALEDALARRAHDWELNVKVVKPNESDSWYDLERGAEVLNENLRRADIEEQIRQLQKTLDSMALPNPS